MYIYIYTYTHICSVNYIYIIIYIYTDDDTLMISNLTRQRSITQTNALGAGTVKKVKLKKKLRRTKLHLDGSIGRRHG